MYGTADAVIGFVAATPAKFGVDDDAELRELFDSWLEWVASHIDTRFERTLTATKDPVIFKGVESVAVMTVARIAATAQQHVAAPVVRIEEFAVQVLRTTDAIKDLDRDLEPFLRYDRSKGPNARSISFAVAGKPH